MKQLAIIEDNSIDAKFIQQWCTNLPDINLIKLFSTGFDALHHELTFQADILIVDMHLPLICGLDTISLLRAKKI